MPNKQDRAAARVARLRERPLFDAEWRFTWETFRAYARHEQADMAYRRLGTADGVSAAEYVYRVAAAAMKGRKLPSGRGWSYLESAMRRVYDELGISSYTALTSDRQAPPSKGGPE